MKTTIYILTILLFACGSSADKDNFHQINDLATPYVLDSLPTTDKIYQTDEMKSPANNVIYIGVLSDTININKYDRYSFASYLDFFEYEDSSIIKDGLKILVSKKQLLTIDLEDFSIPPPPALIENNKEFEFDSIETAKATNEWNKRPRDYVQAIPVFIFNATKDTVFLEQQDGSVIMIQEAKDENGVWKPIEFWRYSWCGNSYGAEGLAPNDLAVVKVFNYTGDFETELRLKLKNSDKTIYSHSFKGKINKSQFELPTEIRDKYLARKDDDKEYLDRIFLNK